MVPKRISQNDLGFGRAVLLATDTLGMSVEGAFWLYDSEAKDWQFYLVTSLLDRIGPRKIYMRLDKALQQKLSEHEIESFSFFIASPREMLVKTMRKKVKTGPHASAPVESGLALNGEKLHAVVYRMASGLSEPQLSTAQRRFSRLYNQLVPA